MAGRLMFVHMHDCEGPPAGAKYVSGEYGLPGWEIPDYAPRAEDYAWIARELGDAPMRIIDMDPMPVVALLRELSELAEKALADAERRYFGVPVESLGRES